MIFKKLLALTLCFFITGCVGLISNAKNDVKTLDLFYGADTFTFDFSKTSNAGTLEIYLQQHHDHQCSIGQFRIIIDDEEKVEVYPYSKVKFKLDEGMHALKIFAIPQKGWAIFYKEYFGKTTITEINIEKDKVVVLNYIGPSLMWSEGKLKQIQ